MSREFYCSCCGLFFWERFGEYAISYRYRCPSCNEGNSTAPNIWAVDTLSYVYFVEANKDHLPPFWTSKEYSPKILLNEYKNQGVEIREESN